MSNTKNTLVNCCVNVHAYKYNGSLYREWSNAKVISDNKRHLAIFMYKNNVKELNNQKWKVHDPTVWFFPKNKMFNAAVTYRNSKFYIYINIASSYLFEDNTIKFIDYDLDIKSYPDKNFEIIDRDDFEANKIKMAYPQLLISKVISQVKHIAEDYIKGNYLFDKKFLKQIIDPIIQDLNINTAKKRKKAQEPANEKAIKKN